MPNPDCVAARKALEDFPCAGIGLEKLKEVACWLNVHQSIILRLLERQSDETYDEILKRQTDEILADARSRKN